MPFVEAYALGEQISHGRIDADPLTKRHARSVSFAHPDVQTVRRIDPALPLNIDWIKKAPTWATPLVMP
jgi:hypothetical protein